jgi:hypothetical protein
MLTYGASLLVALCHVMSVIIYGSLFCHHLHRLNSRITACKRLPVEGFICIQVEACLKIRLSHGVPYLRRCGREKIMPIRGDHIGNSEFRGILRKIPSRMKKKVYGSAVERRCMAKKPTNDDKQTPGHDPNFCLYANVCAYDFSLV